MMLSSSSRGGCRGRFFLRKPRTSSTSSRSSTISSPRASSKSSKLGRFPPVPVRERSRGQRRDDNDDDNNKNKHFERVLDELRARSGHDASSSFSTRGRRSRRAAAGGREEEEEEEDNAFLERERSAFEEVWRNLSATASVASGATRRLQQSSSKEIERFSLYATLKNESLYNLYAMETKACSNNNLAWDRNGGKEESEKKEKRENDEEVTGEEDVSKAPRPYFEQLSIGLFVAPDATSSPSSSFFMRNAAGMRAKLEPIFSESSWEAFAERLAKTCSVENGGALPGMRLAKEEGRVGGREKECYYYNPPIALIYETVARFQRERGKRKPSDELLAFCTSQVKQLSPDDVGYKYGVRATFAGVDPREPDVVRAKEHALRFVVLETENGYAFALASYAPDTDEMHSVVKSSLAWAQKPANYSSGTRFEVARALVNTIAASVMSSKESKLSEMTFLDPFCGSGTLCVAAKQLGFGNVIGSDATGHLIEKSQRNARWFFGAASGAQAVPSEEDAPGSPFPRFQQANAFIRTSFTSDPRETVVVSNLPFGRNVDFVPPPEDGNVSSTTTSHLQLALETLKPLARAHAFISGVPIGEEMVKLGYENVSQIALDRRGKMFIAMSCSDDDSAIFKVTDEDVWFTVDEALRFDEIRQANASKRAAMRKNNDDNDKEDNDKVSSIEIARTNPNALKIIVDLSYEHDSTRALRSVAKQLCEITSVGKKSKGDLRVTFASFAGDIKYESETFFNADTWNKHVEMLPERAEECDVITNQAGKPNNIIYLSPDADNSLTISELRDPSNVFVVGGIVDLKTRGMPTSKTKALSLGVQARKLPVKALRPDQTHDVLNIDTVVKILRLAWMDSREEEEGDEQRRKGFHRAFDRVLPKRQEKEKPKRLKR